MICTLTVVLPGAISSCDKGIELYESDLLTLGTTKYFESEIFSVNDQNIYGKWRIESISGGFSGQGYEPDFDYLMIKKYGIYAFIRSGKVLEFGKIVIAQWEEGETMLKINLVKDSKSDSFFSDREKYVEFSGDDIMNLISPPADRYNYHFERVD